MYSIGSSAGIHGNITGADAGEYALVLGRFRYIEVGAGSLTIEQRKRLTKELPDTIVYNTWGSSETGGALFTNVTEVVKTPDKVGVVGKPLPHVQVRTLDPEGKPFISDREHPGRLSLKGDMQMVGYWKREELTAQTLKDGWLLTGDMVYTDEEGYVYMLGRADDIINVGGEKVSPIEVENIAGEYDKMKECACIGVQDPEGILGQIPVLFVVARDGSFNEADLQTFLAGRMERYKLPQRYIQIFKLPRNRMEKIDRKELHRMWESYEKGENLSNPVLQTIFGRHSIRKFVEKPVPDTMLNLILEAGLYAPSGHNLQTWRFTVLTDLEKIAELKSVVKKVCEEKKIICFGFENPQALILVSNDVRNATGCQDASCAAENMLLAAHSLGLGGVWLNPLMKICDEKEVRMLLSSYGIPDNHQVWSMVALGYALTEGISPVRKKDVIYYVDKEK